MSSQRSMQRFISLETFSGLLLVAVLVVALLFANTALRPAYDHFLDLPLQIGLGAFVAKKPLLLWVNEGLMAIFFMLLALEIKREILAGELSRPNQLILPVLGAIGGIIFPCIIYIAFNHADAAKMRGWPIATTTDIAFALSIIALLGKNVPASLKATLVALSIVDDILAVVIIAIFYSHDLSLLSLALSGLCISILVILNLSGVRRLAPYMLIGVIMWALVLRSGIHATLAGVAIGLTVPYRVKDTAGLSPLVALEKSLHPWVAFGILPLFVFLNGGISFAHFSWSAFHNSIFIAIVLGLFLGKSLGAFSLAYLAIKCGWTRLPRYSNWYQLIGLFFLTGIGFTMSLFIATLAFVQTPFEEVSRQAVLFGSILATLFGVLFLKFGGARQSR